MADYRIVLVDDHPLMREGLRALLLDAPGVRVVGDAENGRQALDVCRALEPDLLLLDLNMPVMDGLSALPLIRQRWPAIRVLTLTARLSEQNAALALDAGADGYVLKSSTSEVLRAAIATLLAGRPFLDADL